jgi:hypothetical protein
MVPNHRAALVDKTAARIAENNGRSGIESGHALLQKLRPADIIMRRPLEIGRPRKLEYPGEVLGAAEVLRVAVVSDASVPGRVCTADFFGAVTGGVVGNHQFEILEGLREHRLNCRLDVRLPVVHGHADTDTGNSFGHN